MGSSFQHGYNTGVLNAPQNLITAFINSTYYNRFQIIPEKDTVDLIFSIIVSVFCVGGMIGALMTAYIGEKFGRKGGLLINNIFVFIATGFMGFSKTFGSYEMLIIGRFFIGLNSGNRLSLIYNSTFLFCLYLLNSFFYTNKKSC